MTLTELSTQINARLHPEAGHRDVQVAYVYAGVTMSDLIGHAAADVLLITSLNNAQLARIGELMDVPGLCLTDGAEPCADLLRLARAVDMPILVVATNLDATRLAAEACLDRGRAARTREAQA